MEKLLFHNWVIILRYLYLNQGRSTTAFKIAKELNIQTSNVFTNINLLKTKGILWIEKEGRNNKYTLTAKGIKMGELVHKLLLEAK